MNIFAIISMIILAASLTLVACENPPAGRITIMTFNIENGGDQVDFSKTVKAIQKAKADVVGIQEAWGNIPRLAKALSWRYYDQRQHIISRLPLYEAKDSHGLYLLVEVLPARFVAVANMHLPDERYGPDLFKAGKPKTDVEENERKVRLPMALPYINKLAELTERGMPVFLTGDFNSPSHLDGKKIEWQVTKEIQNNGLKDSYREIYPDPIKTPGYTWPAGRPFVANTIDKFNPTPTDIPERLDFIFAGGDSQVLKSKIVGESGFTNVDITVKPWPSDHRAVVSLFAVQPVAIPLSELTPVSVRMQVQGKPSISISETSIKSGEPFTITWHNAPGNRFDYIRITPVNSTKLAWGQAVRLYTLAEINGSVEYNAKNVQGNWLDWYKGKEGHWPLKPGVYDVKLMLDDGYTELAATQVQVK